MRALRRLVARLGGALSARMLDSRLKKEVEEHIALQTEDNLRAGMSLREARRLAVLKFGPIEAIKEDYRDQRSLPLFEKILQDMRYAVRALRRDLGFALIAISILAIGIGASTTIFSVLNALLIRPLPFRGADRLVWIENDFPNNESGGLSGLTSQVPVFQQWQKLNRSFEELEAYNAFFGRGSYSLAGIGEPERLTGVEVTRNLFPMLGVQPQVGRLFLKEEAQPNGPGAVLISHGLWERRFASDPAAIGKSIVLNDLPRTIVGVMPPDFDFGTIFAPGVRTDLFVPAVLEEMQNWGNTLAVIGRLKPDVTLAQAQADFRALMPPLLDQNPRWRGWTGAELQPLHDSVSGRLRNAVLLLTAAVGVMLLIVCVNVGNLLLVRASARRQEIAVRATLGAGRLRLIQQMLTESLLLAGSGGVLGIVLAFFATRSLAALQSVSLPLLHTVRVDGSALTFTLAITMIAGVLFGLAPALETSGAGLKNLKESTRGSTEGRHKIWLRNVLVGSEIALACVLVAGAGLLIRSFLHVLDVDMGFRPERVVALRIDPGAKLKTFEQRAAFVTELHRKVRELPGMEMASVTDALPLDRNRSWGLRAKGEVYPNGVPAAFVRMVLPGYFQTMRIPLIAGRDFTEHDNARSAGTVIVNETAARTLWPNQNAIGKIAITGDTQFQVVGIVKDVRHSGPEQQAGIEFYRPMLQEPYGVDSVDLVMRTKLAPDELAASVRAALRPVDPSLPLTEFRPLASLIARAVSPRRLIVWLLGSFAFIAVLLASLGIYGVVSYTVNRRTQEIGIRMALGASGSEVRRAVLRQVFKLALASLAAGLCAALAASTLIQSLLFGITARDPLTFLIAPLVMAGVALLAGYLPARRASRVDPIAALRVT